MSVLAIVAFLSAVTFGALALSTYRKNRGERPSCRWCGKNPALGDNGACAECLL